MNSVNIKNLQQPRQKNLNPQPIRQQPQPQQQTQPQQPHQFEQQSFLFNPPPQRLPVIYEEPTPNIAQYDEDDVGVSEITEEELDNEINEELGKLVDFASEA